MKKPRLVLFDGNAIVHRAFHAFEGKPLTVRKTGEVVSAVYGFTLMLLKVLNELKPTHYAIAFDRAAPGSAVAGPVAPALAVAGRAALGEAAPGPAVARRVALGPAPVAPTRPAAPSGDVAAPFQ